jgi:MoxR-like ATPase
MREAIEEILRLQTDFSAENTEAMQRRGELIRDKLAGEFRELLPAMAAHSGIDDLQAKGRDGNGSKSRYPWVRVYSKSRSPRPAAGWFLVLLFSRLGHRAVVSLNQGTNHSEGGRNRQRPASELNANTAWARNLLTGKDSFPAKWTAQIDLESQGVDLGSGYELGNVVGVEYRAEAVPSDEDIKQDLLEGLGWLARLYGAGNEGEVEPPALRPMLKVWIFQANPKRYDLLDFLARPSTQPGIVDDWTLRQHADDVSDGDTVLLWTAGDQAGIYAIGTVVGESFMRPRQDWEPENAPPESRTIHYRLDRILLDCPVLREELLNHPVLKDLLVIRQPQGTNFPVTEQQWEALRPLIESPSGTQATPPPPVRFHPSEDLEWLLSETLWSVTEVEDVLDTLRMRRPQIILAGPPGTGKTWVAERIARFLTGGQLDDVHIVQFHPSYAYEDFVEGLRPVASDGQVAFRVVPGALIKVADHARQVDHPVVLVIDEMNRANLPSVFGELLYLLEYRDKEIGLLHRDRFSLPPNLYVIGTMNTADRSIRSVDTALRRRFDMFECPPRPEILDAYYSRAGNHSEVSGLAEGLRKLNDTLTQHIDRHHTIGHTFFMEKSLTQNELRRTWRRQIGPLIDEYFFDQPDLVQQFELTMFWPSHPSQ